METDVSNVLSDLKSLSDNADQIISVANCGNDQVGQWFSMIKEAANAIVKGTYCSTSAVKEKSNSFCKEDIPNLVSLIKGKQNSHRVSTLLAEVNKDNRVRLSHRKPRKSLRKIVLGKKSGNSWKVKNRKSSINDNQDDDDLSKSPVPKLLEAEFNRTLVHGKSYLPELDSSKLKTSQSDFSTPIHQNEKVIVPNTSEATPVTRSKVNLASSTNKVIKAGKKNALSSQKEKSITLVDSDACENTPVAHSKVNLAGGAPEVVKVGKKNIFSSQKEESITHIDNDTHENTPVTRSKVNLAGGATEVVKVDKKNRVISSQKEKSITLIENTPSQLVNSNSDVNQENEEIEFITPKNQTIDLENLAEKSNYVTPFTRSKRKSSVQLSQVNAKKAKNNSKSATQTLSDKRSKEEDSSRKNTFKKAKLAKDVNAVIPGVVLQQNHQIQPEKRILREIQKKEEKVSQNAKKLQSLQKKKIEENKKAREKKMEKAMQQRIKLEKEKEERIRSRTQSKQENLQMTQSESKKGTQKKPEPVSVNKNPYKSQQEGKFEPPQKPLKSPVKKVAVEMKSPKNKNLEINKNTNHLDPSPKELNTTYARSPADVPSSSSVELKSPKNKNLKVNKNTNHLDPSPKEITNTNVLNKLNATYVRSPADVPISSTPPPKPIRNAKKSNEISSEKKMDGGNIVKSSTKADIPLSSTPSSKKIESKINANKTPVSNKDKRPNSYAMTPHENSYVSYDISEIKSDDSDDEETVNQKPLPKWAFGPNLRNALLKQFYSPINVDELFGNYYEPPKLQDIMGMEKKHYYKRTSSAIWLESPNRSRSYQT